MNKYAYDLHIHSCLSSCSDINMTPKRIVNEASKKGLDIIAITDYNCARNIGAVMQAAEGLPLTVIPGIEVTTSEEIHVVCLFPDLESAENAGHYLERYLPHVANNTEYFGKQLVIGKDGIATESFPHLLLNALDISIDKLPQFVESNGGICYPAHIDRSANSILSILGCMPKTSGFSSVEVLDTDQFFSKTINKQLCENYITISSSNAHRLDDIAKNKHFIGLDEPSFGALKRALSSENKVSCK